MAKNKAASKTKSKAKAKAKAKTKPAAKKKAAAESKAKPKPAAKTKAKPKPKPKTKTTTKAKAKSKAKSKAKAGKSTAGAGAGQGVPAAVAATLANAQEQLAALEESPRIHTDSTETTAQDTPPEPVPASPPSPPAVTSGFERMPEGFWPAVNMLCDRPEAVREAYRHGHTGPGSAGIFLGVVALAGGAYGAAMGAANALQGASGFLGMIPLTAVKLPLLLLIMYAFTLAPLYLATRFLGYPYTIAQAAKLLLGATAVTAATLAGTIPIALLLSVSTASYTALMVLHGVLLAIAGFMGALFFTTRTHAIHGRHATIRPLTLMAFYVLLHGMVAVQWMYITGPYIGDPDAPFALLRMQGVSLLGALL